MQNTDWLGFRFVMAGAGFYSGCLLLIWELGEAALEYLHKTVRCLRVLMYRTGREAPVILFELCPYQRNFPGYNPKTIFQQDLPYPPGGMQAGVSIGFSVGQPFPENVGFKTIREG